MGMPMMGGLSTAIAKVGLRGLGINVHYDLDRRGERDLLRRLSPHLSNWTCFDIGANVGNYTAALLAAGASRVIAFEPVPETFGRLREREAIDTPAVEVVNVAVGEQTGYSPFFVAIDARHSSLSSRDGSITGLSPSEFQTVNVRLTTIDAYVAESGIEPDFIKIDVEGFELEVLKGMQATLGRCPPKVIQFEINTHHLKRRQNLADFGDVLPGYALYRLASGSLRPLDLSHYLSNVYAYSNIIGVHNSFRDLLLHTRRPNLSRLIPA
jgi:FkbM family methyltransferase